MVPEQKRLDSRANDSDDLTQEKLRQSHPLYPIFSLMTCGHGRVLVPPELPGPSRD